MVGRPGLPLAPTRVPGRLRTGRCADLRPLAALLAPAKTKKFRKKKVRAFKHGLSYGGSAGARTRDLRLKRPLLYQLSYRPTTAINLDSSPRLAERDRL